MREISICPECGCTNFCVSAHIRQSWLVDENFNFIKVTDGCEEILHRPGGSDLWECDSCHLAKEGDEFLYPLYENTIVKFNLQEVAEALVGDAENYFRIAKLFDSDKIKDCGLFVSANQEVENGKSWYSIHIVDNINNDGCYIEDTDDASTGSILKVLEEVFEATLEKHLAAGKKESSAVKISRPLYVKLFQKLIEAFPEVGS